MQESHVVPDVLVVAITTSTQSDGIAAEFASIGIHKYRHQSVFLRQLLNVFHDLKRCQTQWKDSYNDLCNFVPVLSLTRQVGQVLELKLDSRHFRGRAVPTSAV